MSTIVLLEEKQLFKKRTLAICLRDGYESGMKSAQNLYKFYTHEGFNDTVT